MPRNRPDVPETVDPATVLEQIENTQDSVRTDGSWAETAQFLQGNSQAAGDSSANPVQPEHDPPPVARDLSQELAESGRARSDQPPEISVDDDRSSESADSCSDLDPDYSFSDDSSTGEISEEMELEPLNDYNGFHFRDSDAFADGSHFSVNFVDTFLADKLRAEVGGILDRVIPNLQSRIREDLVTPLDTLELSFPPLLVDLLVDFANKSLCEDEKEAASPNEFRLCLLAYLRAAVYRTSITRTFSEEEKLWYGLQGRIPVGMHRCLDVLRALGGPQPAASEMRWEHRSSETKRFLGLLEERVTSINAQLFLTPATILSIDDDHIRQRSRKVAEETHLKIVNNPKKAVGPVQTACSSALTGFFVSGHYSVKGENILATFEQLFMDIQGARHPSDLGPMTELIVAADRGYLSNETVRFIIHDLGASFIGTHKRAHGYPFVYGSSGLATKHRGMVIPEKGGRAVFYATKMSKGRAKAYVPGAKLTAIAYREAVNGRVALFLTSVKEFSIGWSTVPRRVSTKIAAGSDAGGLLLHGYRVIYRAGEDIERYPGYAAFRECLSALQELTRQQSSCKGWFIQRSFRFTSKTCFGCVKVLRLAQQDPHYSLSEGLLSILRVIYAASSDSAGGGSCTTDAQRDTSASVVELREKFAKRHKLTVPILNQYLATFGLLKSGRKADKIARLKAFLQSHCQTSTSAGQAVSTSTRTSAVTNNSSVTQFQPSAFEQSYLKEAFDSWILRPATKDTAAMMVGRANEPLVLARISTFLRAADSPFLINCIVDTGLVCGRNVNSKTMADSPDGLASCRLRSQPRSGTAEDEEVIDLIGTAENASFTAAIEVKTLSSERRLRFAFDMVQTVGQVLDIDADSAQCRDLYMKATMSTEYRCQCLHHAAVTNTTDVLFVVASSSKIIYVLRLRYSEALLSDYRTYMEDVSGCVFSWIGALPKDIPSNVTDIACPEDEGTEVEAFFSYYSLCMSAHRHVAETGTPLEETAQIKPRAALMWNAVKGGTDEFSRALSDLKVEIVGSRPFCKYVLRYALTQIYNSFLCYRLLKFQNSKFGTMEVQSYKLNRKRITKQMSFLEYIRRLVDQMALPLDESKGEEKHDGLHQRFNRNILASFSGRDMWILRSRGRHEVKWQPFREAKNANGSKYRVRIRKWCVICSQVLKRDDDGKILKKGRKTSTTCAKCLVPLCNPEAKETGGKLPCWNVFHGMKDLRCVARSLIQQTKEKAGISATIAEDLENMASEGLSGSAPSVQNSRKSSVRRSARKRSRTSRDSELPPAKRRGRHAS